MKEITELVAKVVGYEAWDGTRWNTAEECEAHENEINNADNKMYSIVMRDKVSCETLVVAVMAVNKKHAIYIIQEKYGEDKFNILTCEVIKFGKGITCEIYFG